MSANETIADIAAEKREMAAKIRAELSQVPARREDQLLEAESLEREADRIEAAAKREHLSRRAIKVSIEVLPTGNAAAMREALETARDLLLPQCNGGTAFAKGCGETVNKIMDALAEPPRNCDVGTADEQGERFERFCHAAGWDNCSKTCPLYAHSRTRDDCAIQWAQMPYEEAERK